MFPGKNAYECFIDVDGKCGTVLDKGVADLLAAGAIKVLADVEPRAFTEHGLLLSDGQEVKADAVIFACVLYFLPPSRYV